MANCVVHLQRLPDKLAREFLKKNCHSELKRNGQTEIPPSRGSTSLNLWTVSEQTLSEANPQARLGVLGFLVPARPRQRVNLSKTWLLMYDVLNTQRCQNKNRRTHERDSCPRYNIEWEPPHAALHEKHPGPWPPGDDLGPSPVRRKMQTLGRLQHSSP